MLLTAVLIGLGAVFAALMWYAPTGLAPISEETRRYYAQGGRQVRRCAQVDWSPLFREAPGTSVRREEN